MPRTVQEILDHADELARRFEEYEPDADDKRDGAPLVAVRQAVTAVADAERELMETIRAARAAGHPWAAIGTLLGTSGEAARQRYGHLIQAKD